MLKSLRGGCLSVPRSLPRVPFVALLLSLPLTPAGAIHDGPEPLLDLQLDGPRWVVYRLHLEAPAGEMAYRGTGWSEKGHAGFGMALLPVGRSGNFTSTLAVFEDGTVLRAQADSLGTLGVEKTSGMGMERGRAEIGVSRWCDVPCFEGDYLLVFYSLGAHGHAALTFWMDDATATLSSFGEGGTFLFTTEDFNGFATLHADAGVAPYPFVPDGADALSGGMLVLEAEHRMFVEFTTLSQGLYAREATPQGDRDCGSSCGHVDGAPGRYGFFLSGAGVSWSEKNAVVMGADIILPE